MEVKQLVIYVVLGIIALVTIFYVVGSLAPTIQTSSNVIQYPNNCSDGTDNTGTKLAINYTTLYCANSSGADLYLAKLYQLPLVSLFSSSGVLMIILMIGIFVGLLIMVMRMMKK